MIIAQETDLYMAFNVYNEESGDSFNVLLVQTAPPGDYGNPIWDAVVEAIQSAVNANIPTGSVTNTGTTTVVSS